MLQQSCLGGSNYHKGYMVTHDLASSTQPLFSIIIAAYNDWESLDQCLQSLAQQARGPSFEVIIADDGSAEPAPEFIRQWQRYYQLTIERQRHAGISAARNRGAQISRGSVLLFADADSRLRTNCLVALDATIASSSQHNCFQLRLVGDSTGLLGRAEELRLQTIQNQMLQPNGCIRYLNTAGFAIRRSRVDIKHGIFEPAALRAEDTLLLSNLMQAGELPFFVHDAIVQHATRLSLMASLRKSIRSAYLEGRTYEIIASRGVRIRVSQRERLRMLWSMWKTSGQHSIGRAAWFVLVAKQALQRTISMAYYISGPVRALVSRPPEKANSKSPTTTGPTESDAN
jgi:glycosyltransferase involved in cell wall biosynthesis